MDFNEFEKELDKIGLDLKKFSQLTNTPLSTVYGWSAKRKYKTPKWADSFLILYKKTISQKTIIEYLEGKLNEQK